MTKIRWTAVLLAACVLVPGCRKPDPDGVEALDEETRARRHYVNRFAFNVMDTYYLWRDEIARELEEWLEWEEPVAKVAALRYKDEAGNDIDRWTMLTDRFSALQGEASGHSRTFGMDYQLYYTDRSRTRIGAVVTYTSAGSPAEKAGLVRGDVILTVDGAEMTPDNYRTVVQDHLQGGGTVRLGLRRDVTVTLTAVEMYEEPVHTVRLLDLPDGRKVGYLHYTSFTLDSCDGLVDVFRSFTDEGIDEMVLDLRYNGGGYVLTESVLASMLAPVKEVEAGSVFSREVCNAALTEKGMDEVTPFQTGFLFRTDAGLQVVSTKGANPDLKRLFVLVSGGSASASESLVCCLRPYMDVILVGTQTYGKYCSGFLLSAESWYESVRNALEEGEYEKALPCVQDWGIYVMFARYADCNGVTLSMPDGIAPDVEVEDDPLDGYPLGDPRETLLAEALALIEGRTRAAVSAPAPSLVPVPEYFHPRTSGLLVGRY